MISILCAYDRMIPVAELKRILNPQNQNEHPPEQIEELAEQFRFQGVRHPAILSLRTGLIIAGEGRILAAEKAGMESYPVDEQDFLDEAQEYAFGVADNAVASWAVLNLSKIHKQLPDIQPFDISRLAIKDFSFEPKPENTEDADAVPEPPPEAKTKRGELWYLGEHRLLIDDCTVKENVDRLMNGEKADMVFTDPPYGINLDTDWGKRDGNAQIPDGRTVKRNSYQRVHGDAVAFNPEFILEHFKGIGEVFLWGANYYMQGSPEHSWVCWDKKLTESGDKNVIGDFELCWSKHKHKNTMIRAVWHGPFGHNKKTDGDSRVHPTQKPVKICEEFLSRWSETGHRVVDIFLGSGSTLIACEKTKRRCFGMEIEPIYGDVILDRFQKFSGKMPVREDGKTWDEVKNG